MEQKLTGLSLASWTRKKEHIVKEFRELTTSSVKIKTSKHYISHVLSRKLSLGFPHITIQKYGTILSQRRPS